MDEASQRLESLRRAPAAERPALLEAVPEPWRPGLRALIEGPDPTGALARAAGLGADRLRDPIAPALARVLHEGGYPARLLALVPDALELLSEDPRPDSDDQLPVLRGLVERHGISAALGRWRTRRYVWLCRREVEGAPLEEVGPALCELAAACVQVLLEHEGIARDVVVFGMGKLGGNELNFLSDIDLVFVHKDALDRTDVVRLHDALRRVVRALEGEGPWRPLFRVDLRLRPFGARGPLSQSLTATEAYYERHGRGWERQAWLRARPIAGDLALGATLLEHLRPFVYRRSVSADIFDEIAELMARARRPGPAGDGIDVKLDPGGIRQVEFAVQALQLLHGGRNPTVRATGTLPALDRLWAAGLVSDREHRVLIEAYRFLRRVEHRIQLGEGQQSHRVPGDEAARDLLARRLGEAVPEAGARLAQTLAHHRAAVSEVAATMATGAPAPTRRSDVDIATDLGAPPEIRHQALARLGVRDVAEAEALVTHLATRPDGAFSATGPARRGAQALLQACLDAADPDRALARLVQFAEHRHAHYAIWRFFDQPPAAGVDLVRLCAELLGSSEPLSRGLIGFPVARGALPDDSMLLLSATPVLPDEEELERAWTQHPADARGVDATLLRYKHRMLVRVALHDLGMQPPPRLVGRALSDLADTVVRRLASAVAAEAEPGPPLRLAVLALGKLGMQAMDYGSDLDLVFVVQREDGQDDPEAVRRAIAAGQRLVARLTDRTLGVRLYEVDMRLRPSGRQGLLVTGLSAFAAYHREARPTWERLANLRTRPVAEVRLGTGNTTDNTTDNTTGNTGADDARPGRVGAAVMEIVTRALGFSGGHPPERDEVARDVWSLKRRIEAEIARERPGGPIHVKAGPGGLLELELLVSALQLLHGPAHPAARVRDIEAALAGLATVGALPTELAADLARIHRFQRRLLDRLRMTEAGATDDPDRIAPSSPRWQPLARRMGLPDAERLRERLDEARQRVRAALHDRLPDPS